MDGKVVQLVQGREKALEGDAPLEMLRKFAAFPEIQVIDLDAARGKLPYEIGQSSLVINAYERAFHRHGILQARKRNGLL